MKVNTAFFKEKEIDKLKSDQNSFTAELQICEFLMRKFELQKKIYQSYNNSGLSEGNEIEEKDYVSAFRYFLSAGEFFHDVRFYNVALKIRDLKLRSTETESKLILDGISKALL